MNIMQCQFCKRPFASIGGRICPDCVEQIEKNFFVVRDYIEENKFAHIDKIAKDTEVPKQHIMHLLKEGRLIIDSPDGTGGGILFCESCKSPIKTGRLCEACTKTLTTSIGKKVSEAAPKPAAPELDNFKGSAKIR